MKITALSQISTNEELLKELDSFIPSIKKPFSSFGLTYLEETFDKFDEYIKDTVLPKLSIHTDILSNKYEVDLELIYFYYSLDKNFMEYMKKQWNKIFLVEDSFNIKGHHLKSLYSREGLSDSGLKERELLEKHLEVLPTSTKKYIKSKISNEIVVNKVVEISNYFELKTVEKQFPIKFSKSKILKILNSIIFEIKKNNNEQYVIINYIYFFKICENRYTNKFNKFIFSLIEYDFVRTLRKTLYKPDNKDITVLKKIVLLSKDEKYKNFFDLYFSFIPLHYLELFFFSKLLTKDTKILNNLNNSILRYFELNFSFEFLSFTELEKSLSEQIIAESEKQFFKHTPLLK